ncbi:MAG: indole-3-glycerol phosphate synthase TrpC [Leptolyngbya sp. SIO4C1]|nr:indole-3-glycerol phosphate synthase TrpC [Leptolyngbya sp. SIO4C1]
MVEIRRLQPNRAVSVSHLQYQVRLPEGEPRNILEKIVWHKEIEVGRRREKQSLSDLQRQVLEVAPALDFVGALRQGKTRPAVIAEVKKASPSKGVIRADFDPVAIAAAYEAGGASCLSVLTDAEFFQGSFDYLRQIRQQVRIPLLCKEFILYPYQIYLARVSGADAILLIAAILSDEDLRYFVKIAKALGMAALVEVHSQAELTRVLQLESVQLIGINNRNLEDFSVALATTEQLVNSHRQVLQARQALVVSESGIHSPSDVQQVATAGAQAILVGESLMRQPDPGAAIASLVQPTSS